MNLQTNIQWDIELIKRHDKSGPRYTSYPTAVQFLPGFDLEQYQQARLSSHKQEEGLSLYVHIPFCAHVCYYCACNKVITKRREKAEPYLEALFKEIEIRAQGYNDKRSIDQLHFGGGTPTFLNNEQMSSLMNKLAEHFNLSQSQDRDFSIEIDPRELEEDTLAHLKSIGFNRVSLGVQDVDPAVQKAVNRVQPLEMTKATLDQARELDFKSINIDLIYGLPLQNRAGFQKTLQHIIDLSPDRISVFNYAHLPERFMPQRRIQTEDLPNPETKLGMLQDSIQMLTQAGYIYIGMDHFAKPNDSLAQAQQAGKLHRNFQGYTTHPDCDLVALGVSSISQIGHSYMQNSADIEVYQSQLEQGVLPINKGLTLTDEDELRQAVIKQLICHFNLSFSDIEQRFNINPKTHFAKELDNLQRFEEDGLLSVSSQGIQVHDKGILLIRSICMVFDEYLTRPDQGIRYSKVI
ncbi:MAG: oxygen-independent coproporphyrinogen III oxidase [Bermanella sp.]